MIDRGLEYLMKITSSVKPYRVTEQSGTKQNSVAKILATKFGVFFVIYIIFLKYVQYESNDNVMKNYDSVIPHDWDMRFEKFGGLPTVVALWEN